jgi:hypothetical protein
MQDRGKQHDLAREGQLVGVRLRYFCCRVLRFVLAVLTSNYHYRLLLRHLPSGAHDDYNYHCFA